MGKISNEEIVRLSEIYADVWADKNNDIWMSVRCAYKSGMLNAIKILNEDKNSRPKEGDIKP
jgi:hypothetical protein